MTTTRLHRVLAVAAVGLVLAGCGGGGGGGGGGSSANGAPPPASASNSSAGFLAYIAGLANRMFEQSEPADLTNFNAPTDNTETREPIPTANDA